MIPAIENYSWNLTQQTPLETQNIVIVLPYHNYNTTALPYLITVHNMMSRKEICFILYYKLYQTLQQIRKISCASMLCGVCNTNTTPA